MQEIPEQDAIDLAIIAVPAWAVKDVMHDCVDRGVKGAIIISAGFKETGVDGARLEKEVLEIAQQGHIRVVGPNCLGVMVRGCIYFFLEFRIFSIRCRRSHVLLIFDVILLKK